LYIEVGMRTNIDIDENLMRQAMRASGVARNERPWIAPCGYWCARTLRLGFADCARRSGGGAI
jgi:hypothetical protein